MAQLSINLLGSFQVQRAGAPVTRFRGDKVRALLAYLAVEPELPVARSVLAGLLWPEQPEGQALRNLSQALARLGEALGEPPLLVTRQAIQWRPGAAEVDVRAFTRLASSSETADLAQAAALYRGELLAGFSLPGCEAFEEWLLLTRERLQQQALSVLHTLTEQHLAARRLSHAAASARRQIELDPWREEAHRQLMLALALGGNRAAALAQYAACCQVLKDDLGVECDDETRLLAERIRAGEFAPAAPDTPTPAGETGIRADEPAPLPAAPTPTHSLPLQLTPFVGREEELAEIAARLRQPGLRLLTLVGAGGMGKTRLALEVAWAQVDRLASAAQGAPAEAPGDVFPDGVFFVALAPLNSATQIVPAVAAAVGLALRGDDPKQALLQFLRDKRWLLVLDNFEHVLDGVGLVMELLQAAPHLQIVVTSRERLNVRGEQLYFVEGMDRAAEDVAVSSAVRLFVQSARRAQPGFKLSPENAPAVLRICELVQGMPLGIELAAAWSETLPLDTIAAEIERSADFLAFDWRDAPERQRSMRAVFDWSWQLLTEAERQVYRRLAVFRGGWTYQAAQVVAGATLRVLTGLVHKSLLRSSRGHAGAGRYEMHELLRQFAAEQLEAAPDELAMAEERHSRCYLAFVVEREQRMARGEPREATDELRGEIDNIRKAWGWAARQRAIEDLDASAYTLWQFYTFSGLIAEGERAFQLAAEQLGAHEPAPPPGSQRVLSKLLAIRASLLISQSKHDQALALAEQALALAQASGSVEGEALGTLARGQALRRKGQNLEARALFEQAIASARRHQTPAAPNELLYDVEWLAHVWLGSIASNPLHDYAAARGYLEQAMQLCQRLGKMRGELITLHNLASLDYLTHNYAAARRGTEQGLVIARKLGYRWGEALSLGDLSDVVRMQGEYSLAYELAERALTMLEALGATVESATALVRLAHLSTVLGDYAQAQAWFDQFFQILRIIESPAGELLDGLLRLAVFAHSTGDPSRALAYAAQSLQIAQEQRDPSRQAHALIVEAYVLAGLGRHAEAAPAYQRALAFAGEIDDPALLAEARAGLASVALAQRDLAAARAQVEALLAILDDYPRAGLDEPFFAYLVCYRVLDALRDPRAAAVLEAGQRLLREYADNIASPALRQSFLENVATHRELLAAGPR